jgi:drug/metabolite transporter (DMT)-like permease
MTNKTSSSVFYFLIAVILLWGINWPMNKIGIEYMPSIWHATLRIGLGSASMFLFVILLGKFKIPTKKDLPVMLTTGLLQMGLFSMLINLGLMYVEAGRSAILVYTIPLWITPLALFFFKEKLNPLKLLGLILGIGGIIILFSPWSMDWSDPHIIYGNCFLIGAAITMAISICCCRNMQWQSSPLELLPWQLFIGTLPVWLIATIMEPEAVIQWNKTSISAMAHTAVLATAIGNFGLTIVSRKLPSITVSLGLLGVPMTGVISAALILGEVVTLSMRLAMVFIFSGLICVAISGKVKVRTPLVSQDA